MKLGFLTSILQDYDFEQVMDFAIVIVCLLVRDRTST